MNAFSTLPPPAFAAALFDADQFCVLGEMSEEGDAEILAEVVQQFLEDAGGAMENLQTGIEEEDFDAILRGAHTLKGSYATFGLMRAHALAREIEQLAEAGRSSRLLGLYREMVGSFAAGRRALEAHMERQG